MEQSCSSTYFVKLISRYGTLGKICQSVKGKVSPHGREFSPVMILQGSYLQVELAVPRAIKFAEEYSLPGAKNQAPGGNDHRLG